MDSASERPAIRVVGQNLYDFAVFYGEAPTIFGLELFPPRGITHDRMRELYLAWTMIVRTPPVSERDLCRHLMDAGFASDETAKGRLWRFADQPSEGANQ